MKELTAKKVRLIYGSLLGLMTVIVGALFIWQTLDIYFSGTAADYTGTYIYTSERVVGHLKTIAPAFWLWVGMIAVGFVVWEVFPLKSKRGKQDVRYTLYRFKKRISNINDNPSSAQFVKREELIVKILWLCCGIFCAIAVIYAIVYLSIPSNFPAVENKTIPIIEMAVHILPFVASALLLCCGVAVYEGVSAKKQLPHVKKLASKTAAAVSHSRLTAVLQSKNFILGLRVAVGCVGVAFVIIGILNGNARDVLIKAINICTECIGLG